MAQILWTIEVTWAGVIVLFIAGAIVLAAGIRLLGTAQLLNDVEARLAPDSWEDINETRRLRKALDRYACGSVLLAFTLLGVLIVLWAIPLMFAFGWTAVFGGAV